jgi:hypothetical protein
MRGAGLVGSDPTLVTAGLVPAIPRTRPRDMSFLLAARMRPSYCKKLPPRGRGECRMPDAPAASCAHIGNEYAHEYSQRATGITRHSRTQWFTAYFVLSPATGFLATVVMRIRSTNLTPAPGRQDHTFSPSARIARSSVAPPASTASRPAFATIASAPVSGRDGDSYSADLAFLKIRIFSR